MNFDHLTISGFGPYAGTHEIDFAALATKGLFSVTGQTGSGKTTIFDALTYALYGDLPGLRPSTNVRSAHADVTQKSEVQLVFTAANDRWKVVRTPAQSRPKHRGTGVTEIKPTASLFRWDGTGWEGTTTNSNEVRKQCIDLVGLTKDQFERVGLLPQGEFKRLLVATSAQRKALFRTLFGTSAIESAVGRLHADAREAEEAARTARLLYEEVEGDARPILDELDDIASSVDDGVLTLRLTLDDLGTGEDSVLSDLAERSSDVEMRILPQLEGAEAAANSVSTAASQALGRAKEQALQVESLAKLKALRIALNERRPDAEAGAALVERARRAAPVIAAERDRVGCQQRLDSAIKAVDARRDAVVRLAGLHDVSIDPDGHTDDIQQSVAGLIPAVKRAADDSQEHTRVGKDLASLQGQLAGTTSGIAARDERLLAIAAALVTSRESVQIAEDAAAAVVQHTNELVPLEAAEANARSRDEATDVIDRLGTIVDAGRAALQELEATGADQSERLAQLQSQIDQLPALTTARDDATRLLQTIERQTRDVALLERVQVRYGKAADELVRVGRAFALGIAPRLASQLEEGEPCLVCGSPNHPDPATGEEDHRIDDAQLDAATEAHHDALAEVRALQSSLAEQSVLIPADLTIECATEALARAEQSLAEADAARAGAAEIVEHQKELESNRVTLIEQLSQAQGQVDASSGALNSARKALGVQCDVAIADIVVIADAHRSRLTEATERAATLPASRMELEALSTELETVRTDRAALAATLAAEQANVDARQERLTELTETLKPWEGIDLVERLEGLNNLLAAGGALANAVDAFTISSDRLERELKDRAEALEKSQFPSLAEALAADLDVDQIDRLEREHQSFQQESNNCDSQLQQLVDLDVPGQAPDLGALEAAATEAQSAATAATKQKVSVSELVARANELVVKSVERLGEITTLTAEADRRTAVAKLCDAKGASKIGLEGFILRRHLEQVVVQANLRLDSLSRGRYQMTLADEALDKRGEWGLDLTITDAHTGTTRPVTTLSGGETFYTSLSLALGLSDVLSNRGATTISSVFIDEGFGSLDEGAIDDAIDVLNQLRSDGVTIGVITHVGALRDALPAGIAVEKLPTGGSRVVQAA